MEGAMPRIEITVPADLSGELDERLGSGASTLIAQAAFEEWAHWLLASSRPLSISELEIARVHTVYNDVLVDELPIASQLSARLQLPIARCRYIIQSLGYQYPSLMRTRVLKALKVAYQASTPHADVHAMDIPPECAETLDDMLSQIADSAQLAELRGKRHGNIIRYELTKGYYQRVGKAIDDALAAAKQGA
jgi:hypothetical protein